MHPEVQILLLRARADELRRQAPLARPTSAPTPGLRRRQQMVLAPDSTVAGRSADKAESRIEDAA